MKNILYLTDFGRDIKEEKEKIKLKERVLDMALSIKSQNIQILFQQGITKMVVKY